MGLLFFRMGVPHTRMIILGSLMCLEFNQICHTCLYLIIFDLNLSNKRATFLNHSFQASAVPQSLQQTAATAPKICFFNCNYGEELQREVATGERINRIWYPTSSAERFMLFAPYFQNEKNQACKNSKNLFYFILDETFCNQELFKREMAKTLISLLLYNCWQSKGLTTLKTKSPNVQ